MWDVKKCLNEKSKDAGIYEFESGPDSKIWRVEKYIIRRRSATRRIPLKAKFLLKKTSIKKSLPFSNFAPLKITKKRQNLGRLGTWDSILNETNSFLCCNLVNLSTSRWDKVG
jgi:hypothetical protein